jgi:hypothetical protein
MDYIGLNGCDAEASSGVRMMGGQARVRFPGNTREAGQQAACRRPARRDRTALRAADGAWPGPPRAARSVRTRRAPLPPHRASGRTEVASATVLPAPAGGARIRSWRGRHHVEVAQAVQLSHELAPSHGVVVRVPRGTAHRHKDRRDKQPSEVARFCGGGSHRSRYDCRGSN